MSEEWSQWYQHDGKGCPVKGLLVQTEDGHGKIDEHIAYSQVFDTVTGEVITEGFSDEDTVDLWDWSDFQECDDFNDRIVAYRIKKSVGYKMIENLLEIEHV